MTRPEILIDSNTLSGINSDIRNSETAARALKDLDIRSFCVPGVEEDAPGHFWSLPKDSEHKVGVVVSIADSLEFTAANHLNPDVRILATEHFIDLCEVGYVSSVIGIANPEELLHLPTRLLALIDQEKDITVKRMKLDMLIGTYRDSLMHPHDRAQVTPKDWEVRIDEFINDPNHPLESINLITDLCCRRSGFAYDGSSAEAVKSLYGLKELQAIVRNIPAGDLRDQAKAKATATYKRVIEMYSNDWRRQDIAKKWTDEAMENVFGE